MKEIMTYRGRSITEEDLAVVKTVIAAHPTASRRFISQEVCSAWGWRQPNGHLKDMVCRSLLLLLERNGLIKQPPPQCVPPNPLATRKKPPTVMVDQTPIEGPLRALCPLTLVQVRRTGAEKLFNSLVSQHHYLGYTQPIGEHIKHLVLSGDRPLACLVWSSAPWYIGCRDRFIGWSAAVRQKNLHLIANNTRFLIVPWVTVPHLASHVLALSRRRVPGDWQRLYHHPVHLLETFVDTERFSGTCYKADNWRHVGDTTGIGKLSPSWKPTRSKKAVYVYPVGRGFRAILTSVRGETVCAERP